MVRKVCLDSNILIALLNNDGATRKLLESLDADFYITAINSFEIWHGRKKHELIFQLLEQANMLDFDAKSSRIAGDLLRELKQKGQMIDMRDLFVAAVCIRNDVELLTHNKKHFERLKEFGLVLA